MRIAWVALVLLLASPLLAQSDLVQAKLLADVSAIQPGKAFTLGVLLAIKPGWHVYWKNPGDAGLPTRVKFDPPDGFTAGELQYPAPTRITDPGNIVIFGYPNEVLLTATVTPPAGIKPGQHVSFAAAVKWLCCQVQCVPGQAALKLELPVADEAADDHLALFQLWRGRMPAVDSHVTLSGPLDLSTPAPAVTIDLPNIEGTDCVPDAVDGLTLATNLEGGRKYVLSATKLQGQTVSAKWVQVLITRPDTLGGRTAALVEVPIINPQTPATTTASH